MKVSVPLPNTKSPARPFYLYNRQITDNTWEDHYMKWKIFIYSFFYLLYFTCRSKHVLVYMTDVSLIVFIS
ncbi:hypothetical protein GDO81_021897 [Engystomops pustulosus]|uniref:Uncharacterized protein n=1 Tax=Engystomops pustulosus TaxID=76066 RepID=A0AAV6ZTY4_ENGPU|nr:hypothetical protein GDO81_021897 [Engystomops pustulosus]